MKQLRETTSPIAAVRLTTEVNAMRDLILQEDTMRVIPFHVRNRARMLLEYVGGRYIGTEHTTQRIITDFKNNFNKLNARH